MTNPPNTAHALLSTAALALVTVALAGCSNPGQAADTGLGADAATDLPWTWKDADVIVRAKSHRYVPFEADSASTMTGTVSVTQGPPVDFMVMTPQDFAAFERAEPFASIQSCAASQQTQVALSTCTIDAGSYVIVIDNRASYTQDDVGTATEGPATLTVDLVLAPDAV